MELLQLNMAQGIKVSDLEKLLKGSKHCRIKSQNEPLRQYKNNKGLDIKPCIAVPFTHVKPTPCKCPTHHKVKAESPILVHNHGCRFKTKAQRFLVSQEGRNIKSNGQLKRWRGYRRSMDSQNTNKIDCSGTLISEIAELTSNYVQTQSNQLRNKDQIDQIDQITSMRVLNMSRKLISLTNQLKSQKIQDQQTSTRYMKHLDNIKHKFNQINKYIQKKGYKTQTHIITQLLEKVFSDMKCLQQKCRKLCSQRQITNSQLLRKRLLQRLPQSNALIYELKELPEEQKIKESKGRKKDESAPPPQTSAFISQTKIAGVKSTSNNLKQTVFNAKKLRSINHVNLKKLLEEVESNTIDQIAHADRQDLLEGLEFLENALNAELIKSRTSRQVPDYIRDQKTYHLLEKVLKTIENSSQLSSYDIIMRSQMIQGGLNKIRRYESEIKNQAQQIQLIQQQSLDQQSDFENQQNTVKKPKTHRNGLLKNLNKNTPQQIETNDKLHKNSILKKDSKGYSRTASRITSKEDITQSFSMSINNRVFSKKSINRATEGDFSKELAATGSSFFQKGRHDSRKQYRQDWEQQYINSSIRPRKNRTSKRRKGLNKLTMISDDLALKYNNGNSLDDNTSPRSTKQGIWSHNKLNNQQELATLEDTQNINKNHKIQNIVKDINRFLKDKNLTRYIIHREDDSNTRRRKLNQLKNLVQKSPEYNSSSLLKNIQQYEHYDRQYTQEKKFKHNNHLVIESILSLIKDTVPNQLKWTNDIHLVQRRKEDKNFQIFDCDEIVKEPFNKRRNQQQKLQARIRQQQNELKQETLPVKKMDDLGQAQPSNFSPYQDTCVWRQRRGQGLQTEPNSTPTEDSSGKLRTLIRHVHRNHRQFFNDLLHSQFMSC